MRRYSFLDKKSTLIALRKLRTSFLAAKDGEEVETITKGVLTHDERLKIGRRIQIAEMIDQGIPYRKIAATLKVGSTTVMHVANRMQKYPDCFKLIFKRQQKVEREYKKKAYQKVGGPKLIFKRKVYTGLKRKHISR